jgi:hypothetical protein
VSGTVLLVGFEDPENLTDRQVLEVREVLLESLDVAESNLQLFLHLLAVE